MSNKKPIYTDEQLEEMFSGQKIQLFERAEQPLTHHQQAVKDFMVALVGSIHSNTERAEAWATDARNNGRPFNDEIAIEADKLADAFINQINKK